MMSKDHLKDLPIQKKLRKILKQREKFQVLMAYNTQIEGLLETDEKIKKMPEGKEKQDMIRQQEEAWELMVSDDMISLIKIEEE